MRITFYMAALAVVTCIGSIAYAGPTTTGNLTPAQIQQCMRSGVSYAANVLDEAFYNCKVLGNCAPKGGTGACPAGAKSPAASKLQTVTTAEVGETAIDEGNCAPVAPAKYYCRCIIAVKGVAQAPTYAETPLIPKAAGTKPDISKMGPACMSSCAEKALPFCGGGTGKGKGKSGGPGTGTGPGTGPGPGTGKGKAKGGSFPPGTPKGKAKGTPGTVIVKPPASVIVNP